mgnify:CR=1 FL=1
MTIDINSITQVKKMNKGFNGTLSCYKVSYDGIVSDVPADSPDNTDYQTILQWEADGNTIEEAD